MEIKLSVSELPEKAPLLHAADTVYLTGTIYTARDAAHKKIASMIHEGQKLPFELRGSVIYYAGPTPARPGTVIGSCGPTTSSRMDVYTPLLLSLGLAATIGKGGRSEAVRNAIREYGAPYFCAIGGAGAYYASCIEALEVVAFPELGCESVKRLQIKDFPLIVAEDIHGNSLFLCQ